MDIRCPKCDGEMLLSRNRYGDYYRCKRVNCGTLSDNQVYALEIKDRKVKRQAQTIAAMRRR